MAPTGRFELPRRWLADLAIFKTALLSHLSMWAYMVLPTGLEPVLSDRKSDELAIIRWEHGR